MGYLGFQKPQLLGGKVYDKNKSLGSNGQVLSTDGSTGVTWATLGNGQLTLNVSGTGLSGSQTFTANQTSNATFTVTSNATSSNTTNTIVARDGSGNFSAGTITATLNGNASTATNATTATTLQTARTINGVSFNGSSNITISASTTYSLTLGSYLTGTLFNGATAVTAAVDATSENTASKVVARDGSGNFSAGTISVSRLEASFSGQGDNYSSIKAVDLHLGTNTSAKPSWNALLNIGNTTSNNDSQVVIKNSNSTALSILALDNLVYFTSNLYYENGLWVHSAPSGGTNSQIFGLEPTSGVKWWASSNSSSSFNLSNSKLLWNNSGEWASTLSNTLTLNTSGTGLSGSTTYNNSGAVTFTVTSNATSANTGSTIVARDASGNFSAGTITATKFTSTSSYFGANNAAVVVSDIWVGYNLSSKPAYGAAVNISGTSYSNSQVVIRDNSDQNAFSIYTQTNITYLANNTIFDNGSWSHAAANLYTGNVYSQLLILNASQGVKWNASSNSTASWNLSNGTLLWNNSGQWASTLSNTLTLNTSGTGISGSTTYNNSGAATFTVTSNATSSNASNTIVARDSSGNFSAGTITASSFIGPLYNTLTLNTSGTGISGSTTYNNSGSTTFTVTSNATSSNTASTIVARDASGNFSAATISALKNTLVASNDSGTGGGQLYLNGSTGNRIDFNTNGVSAPSFTTRSVGTKIVLYPALSGSATDYAIGIDNSTFWSTVDGTSSSFKWYGGTTLAATLTATGNLTAVGTLQGTRLISTISTGTAPLSVTSTTEVSNLNVQYLNGYQSDTANSNNTIVRRSSDGTISVSYLQITNQFQSTQANSTTTGGGQIYLNGGTGNRIDFNQNGVAAPAFTTRSVGTKIVLYPALSGSTTDYAFGIESGALWSSIPASGDNFKWYAGTTTALTLTGGGNLTAIGTVQGTRFISTIATGTQPLTVSSTTEVSNLNVQYLNGYSSATTNTANAIVRRDGSGNFSAGTITATLNGNASTATNASNSDASLITNTSTNATYFVNFTSATSGYTSIRAASGNSLSFNPSTQNLVVGGTITTNSDRRLKKDIETIGDALNKVLSMRGVRYVRKDTNETQVGLIAQEVEEVFPEVVRGEDIKSVAYGNLIGVLVEAIKEQNRRIEELEFRLGGG